MRVIRVSRLTLLAAACCLPVAFAGSTASAAGPATSSDTRDATMLSGQRSGTVEPHIIIPDDPGDPPMVISRTPANGATAVGVAANVRATFGEPVNGVDGTTFQLTDPTGTPVAAAVTRNGTTNEWILNPGASLAADVQYTASLSSGITDAEGDWLNPTFWSFTTAGGVNQPPTVTGRAPSAAQLAVPVSAAVTATFSEPVNGVDATTFRVTDPAGRTVPATVARDGTTNQWILRPVSKLAADTRYRVTLTAGAAAIRDLDGAPLAGSTTWTFLTGPRPTIGTRSPAGGATGVPRNVNVLGTFSEAVANVTGTTVTLRTGVAATGTAQPAVVTYDPATRRLTVDPIATLPANTQFTVRLTAGITDTAGNRLAPTQWTFRTGTAT